MYGKFRSIQGVKNITLLYIYIYIFFLWLFNLGTKIGEYRVPPFPLQLHSIEINSSTSTSTDNEESVFFFFLHDDDGKKS